MKLVLLALAATSLYADQYVEWRTNYQEALLEARQSHKPLFVEFRCEA
jgi:hypothetical protein